MGNLLFQQARDAVENAVSCSSGTEQQDLVYRAKNSFAIRLRKLFNC